MALFDSWFFYSNSPTNTLNGIESPNMAHPGKLNHPLSSEFLWQFIGCTYVLNNVQSVLLSLEQFRFIVARLSNWRRFIRETRPWIVRSDKTPIRPNKAEKSTHVLYYTCCKGKSRKTRMLKADEERSLGRARGGGKGRRNITAGKEHANNPNVHLISFRGDLLWIPARWSFSLFEVCMSADSVLPKCFGSWMNLGLCLVLFLFV